jgi:hypothetical protein
LHEEIWVVKETEYLRLNLDRLPLGDVQRPRQSQVNFVDPRTIERVISDARYRSGAGDSAVLPVDSLMALSFSVLFAPLQFAKLGPVQELASSAV